jgi:putative ABC transport system permease protein
MFDVRSPEPYGLISYELAVVNDLGVGDIITLAHPNDPETTFALTVSGIFLNTGDAGNPVAFMTAMDPANLIAVSAPALHALEAASALTGMVSGTYAFTSLADFEAFRDELPSRGLPEQFALTSADASSFEASIIPLDNLIDFAATLLFIILGVGAVVLFVLNIFNIRERKYEVGVLTAIGIKKTKVAAQFVAELLAVTLVAIVVGAGAGAIVSGPISNNLLESQVAALVVQQAEQAQNFGRFGNMDSIRGMAQGFGVNLDQLGGLAGAGSGTQYIEVLNASLNVFVLLQLIGIGVILAILSSLAGVVFVLRYEPLRILAERT